MPRRILICDDESHIRRAVAIKLECAGYRTEMAADGAEALVSIRRCVPALLITDYHMPRLDGLALAEQLRSDPATALLPIILLTARGLDIDADEARQRFAICEVVAKPFSTRELVGLIRRALPEQSPADGRQGAAGLGYCDARGSQASGAETNGTQVVPTAPRV